MRVAESSVQDLHIPAANQQKKKYNLLKKKVNIAFSMILGQKLRRDLLSSTKILMDVFNKQL